MVIDFHTHNFPDVLAPRAMAVMTAKLEGRFKPVGDGTLAGCLAAMRHDGIDKAVMCPVATKSEHAAIILQGALDICSGARGAEAAERIITFGSVCPHDENARSNLHALAVNGIKGIKVHPYYQNFKLDGEEYVDFFKAACDEGLVVVAHCGLDLGYAHSPMWCGPKEIAHLLEQVPGLKLVAAHLGGFSGNAPGDVRKYLAGASCYLDTAVLSIDRNDPEALSVMQTWPADRLVFGSDYPWTDQRDLINWIEAQRPNETEQELIFGRNAEQLLEPSI